MKRILYLLMVVLLLSAWSLGQTTAQKGGQGGVEQALLDMERSGQPPD